MSKVCGTIIWVLKELRSKIYKVSYSEPTIRFDLFSLSDKNMLSMITRLKSQEIEPYNRFRRFIHVFVCHNKGLMIFLRCFIQEHKQP